MTKTVLVLTHRHCHYFAGPQPSDWISYAKSSVYKQVPTQLGATVNKMALTKPRVCCRSQACKCQSSTVIFAAFTPGLLMAIILMYNSMIPDTRLYTPNVSSPSVTAVSDVLTIQLNLSLISKIVLFQSRDDRFQAKRKAEGCSALAALESRRHRLRHRQVGSTMTRSTVHHIRGSRGVSLSKHPGWRRRRTRGSSLSGRMFSRRLRTEGFVARVTTAAASAATANAATAAARPWQPRAGRVSKAGMWGSEEWGCVWPQVTQVCALWCVRLWAKLGHVAVAASGQADAGLVPVPRAKGSAERATKWIVCSARDNSRSWHGTNTGKNTGTQSEESSGLISSLMQHALKAPTNSVARSLQRHRGRLMRAQCRSRGLKDLQGGLSGSFVEAKRRSSGCSGWNLGLTRTLGRWAVH
jgi:hypothetical protein